MPRPQRKKPMKRLQVSGRKKRNSSGILKKQQAIKPKVQTERKRKTYYEIISTGGASNEKKTITDGGQRICKIRALNFIKSWCLKKQNKAKSPKNFVDKVEAVKMEIEREEKSKEIVMEIADPTDDNKTVKVRGSEELVKSLKKKDMNPRVIVKKLKRNEKNSFVLNGDFGNQSATSDASTSSLVVWSKKVSFIQSSMPDSKKPTEKLEQQPPEDFHEDHDCQDFHQDCQVSLIPTCITDDHKERSYYKNRKTMTGYGTREADNFFRWLISPKKPTTFFRDVWKQKPHHLERNPVYYNGSFSSGELRKILLKERWNVNEDIRAVKLGIRKKIVETYNGRTILPLYFWADRKYKSGFSVQVLNASEYSASIGKMCSFMQEYFSSCTRANVCLTPPGCQDFVPHYDGAETFVLQIEGAMLWKAYTPRDERKSLPTHSGDLDEKDVGKKVLEKILLPGSLLYIPRGFVYQSCSLQSYSLHIKISTCVKNTYGDLLKKVMLCAIDSAMESDVRFRESLPSNYLDHDDSCKEKLLEETEDLVHSLLIEANIEKGIDKMAIEFIRSSLPPSLTHDEKSCSKYGGRIHGAIRIDTKISFIRKRSVRLIRVNEGGLLHHSFENSPHCRDNVAHYIKIEERFVPAVEQLMKICPKYIEVGDLDLSDNDAKIKIASILYEKGLIRRSRLNG